MEINDFYKSILESTGVKIGDDGLVSVSLGKDEAGNEKLIPYEVGKERKSMRRLALPINDVLRSADWKSVIAFHPMSENILKGESPILKCLNSLMVARLGSVALRLMGQLLYIGANTSYHGKLTPKQSELLIHLQNANESTIKVFNRLIDKIRLVPVENEEDTRLLKIFLKRGGVWKGSKRARVAVVNFPLLEEFAKGDNTIYGVKMSNKDKECILNLINFIFPEAGDVDGYSFGSDSQIAPYFHALLHAYGNVAGRLNSIVKEFKKHLKDADELTTDLSWVSVAADLTPYRSSIPSLDGNEGDVEDRPAEMEAPKQITAAAIGQSIANAAASTPVRQQPVVPVAQPQQVVQAPAPIVEQQVQQPVSTGSGLLAAACANNTGVKVNPNGTVDFTSVVASNPMLQQQQLMLQQQAMGMLQPTTGNGGYAGYHRGVNVSQPQWPMQNMMQMPVVQQPVYQQQPMMVQQPVMGGFPVMGGTAYPGV